MPRGAFRFSELGVTFGCGEQRFFFGRKSASFQGAHALGPGESESRSLHVGGTTVVEREEAG